MKILSIETSCDETGISVVEQLSGSETITLLGNALASQIELHAQYGGVFPAMAKRAHAEKIIPLTIEALTSAGLLTPSSVKTTASEGNNHRELIENLCSKEQEMIPVLIEFFNTYEKPDLDYIAVTVGPGLEPALWVGINTARVLGAVWSIPIIPINHMEGHVVTAAVIETPDTDPKQYVFKNLEFPVLSLLVSGGHTELVLAHSYGQYDKIGQTRDDAVGEAFDKVARMLGLPYPGGPAVSRLAAEFRTKGFENPFILPRPMLHSQDYDFSYSGIKTAALYTVRDLVTLPDSVAAKRDLTEDEKMALAAAFEDAAIEVLVKKTIKAAEEYGVQTVIVGGGVAGNTYLKNQLSSRAEALAKEGQHLQVFFPAPWLATDNAVMIAMAAVARIAARNIQTTLPEDLKANGNLSIASAV